MIDMMNNYIYNIKHIHDNYMFHNKELSVNDIVWGYEPKGKHQNNFTIKEQEITICDMCDLYKYHENPNLKPVYREGVIVKFNDGNWFKFCKDCYNGKNLDYLINEMCQRYSGEIKKTYEGTGKVIAKYKVVEVYDYYEEYEKSPYSNAKVSYRTRRQTGVIEFDMNEENNRTYAYKLEKIEDVSMELSKFISWNKLAEYYSNITRGCVLGKNDGEGLKYIERTKLTRYNGLTQVILRSEKE